MQLLVSVRHAAEVGPALLGGADIIDAKESALGALAPVDPERLEQIDERVPHSVAFSVALGDFASPEAAAAAIGALPLRRRQARVYVKLAPTGGDHGDVREVLVAAVRAAACHSANPLVIAVYYADHSDNGRTADELRIAAASAGLHGVLVDTAIKDGRTLLDCWPESRLFDWVSRARSAGLLVGIAGSLGVAEVARVGSSGADVVGVRGAACAGGRSGMLEAARVDQIRRVLGGKAAGAANRNTAQHNRPPHVHS